MNGKKNVRQVKLATRISAVVIAVLVVCMTILVLMVTITARNSMQDTSEARLVEAAEARAAIVKNYFADIETFLAA
ncbi:MAG: hypothetical protein K5853_01745, partial [Lachnospiraceae bacterium]|nr:hypothetical protein [Lachnospiraceae bacterium]